MADDLKKLMSVNAVRIFKEYLRSSFPVELNESSETLIEGHKSTNVTISDLDDSEPTEEVETEEVAPDEPEKEVLAAEDDKEVVDEEELDEVVVVEDEVDAEELDEEVEDGEESDDDVENVEDKEVEDNDDQNDEIKSSARDGTASNTEDDTDTEVKAKEKLVARKRGRPRKVTVGTNEARKGVKRKDRDGDDNTRNSGSKRSKRIARNKVADLSIAGRLRARRNSRFLFYNKRSVI